MILNREQIKAARENAELVAVPEWGENAEVMVRKPGLKAALSMIAADGQVGPDPFILAVIASVVDESGALVFTPEDAEWLLAEKSAASLMRIANAAMGLAAKQALPDGDAEKN